MAKIGSWWGKETKAQRILALAQKGLSTREIADIVGCLPEYVRVVARQRVSPVRRKEDREYARAYYKARKNNPAFMRRRRAINAKHRASQTA